MLKNDTIDSTLTLKDIEQLSFKNYQMGWVCPKCGRVYSPTIPFCLYCGNKDSEKLICENKNKIE